MKIHILYKFREGPWGGANQFLKALRSRLETADAYAHDVAAADVLLFSSYPFNDDQLYRVVRQRQKTGRVVVINRMNGPIGLYRDDGGSIDAMNFHFDRTAADGTIYQSRWSQNTCHEHGMPVNPHEIVIHNAPDPTLFHRPPQWQRPRDDDRIRLIATSWSSNPLKGSDIYQHLDEHLDFSRYTFTLVGNAATAYRNIEVIPPKPSAELGALLREHHVYVFPSKIETCSNALLEALHCGLPAAARNNSSQPELLHGGGRLFDGADDVINAIDQVATNLEACRQAIDVPTLDAVTDAYHGFCRRVYDESMSAGGKPKQLGFRDYAWLRGRSLQWKLETRLKARLRSAQR